jgi:hypothetical protein
MELDELTTVTDGLWLPTLVHRAHFAAPLPGKPLPTTPGVEFTIRVSKVSLGPFPESQFVISPQEGDRVVDTTVVKGPDGKWLPVNYVKAELEGTTEKNIQAAIEQAKTIAQRTPISAVGASRSYLVLWLNLTILGIVCALIIFYRWRRRKPTGLN